MNRFLIAASRALIVLWTLQAVPLLAQENASIVGVVQDGSGGVLPGVTVEASSDALIERTRTVVTDGSGRYNIISLRPGTYSVSFMLEGFKIVRREGVVLAGAFAATVNAALEVGALEETITVSGASPVVDLQSTQNQFVANREVLDVLPATRTMQGGASLVPGVSYYSQGFVSTMSVHGSATADQRMYQDGMRIGQNLTGTGSQANGTGVNDLAQEELVFDAGGQSAETALGGVRMDSIPKEGGNRFSGAFRTFFSNGSLQQRQRPRRSALVHPFRRKLDKTSNFNSVFGGPVMKNRLWFISRLPTDEVGHIRRRCPDANGNRVNHGAGAAPHGTFRLTGQVNTNNKLRGAYYNSNRSSSRARPAARRASRSRRRGRPTWPARRRSARAAWRSRRRRPSRCR